MSAASAVAAAKYQVLVLNQISSHGLHRMPAARYSVGKAVEHPDAVLVRSADMHAMAIPASVKAIGRAGAGTTAAGKPRCAAGGRARGLAPPGPVGLGQGLR